MSSTQQQSVLRGKILLSNQVNQHVKSAVWRCWNEKFEFVRIPCLLWQWIPSHWFGLRPEEKRAFLRWWQKSVFSPLPRRNKKNHNSRQMAASCRILANMAMIYSPKTWADRMNRSSICLMPNALINIWADYSKLQSIEGGRKSLQNLVELNQGHLSGFSHFLLS